MTAAPRVLVIQHERDCPPAWVGDWLVEAGCELDVRRPYAGEGLPELAGYEGFVILGGSMGANDDVAHPWLGEVKELVRRARADGLPTLGICLGHQLIAVALGGTVERNPLGEQVGLLEIGWTDAAAGDRLLGPLATPRRGVQWNNDLVTRLPEDAVLLAETDRGEVQAARFAATVWGVQLHPEINAEVLEPWVLEDLGSHSGSGVDTRAMLREVAAARDELVDAWRPLAQQFAEIVRERRDR